MEQQWRLRLVDDACPFGSGEVAADLARLHPAVEVARLRRNVGQHRAIVEGLLREPAADVWVCLDGDLQDPPEAVPELVRVLRSTAANGVFAGRRGRYEGPGRRWAGAAHRRVMAALSPLPADAGAFFAMDGPLRDAVVTGVADHAAPSVVAAAGASGLRLASVPVQRDPRAVGTSAWTTRQRVRQSVRTLAWTVRHRVPAVP